MHTQPCHNKQVLSCSITFSLGGNTSVLFIPPSSSNPNNFLARPQQSLLTLGHCSGNTVHLTFAPVALVFFSRPVFAHQIRNNNNNNSSNSSNSNNNNNNNAWRRLRFFPPQAHLIPSSLCGEHVKVHKSTTKKHHRVAITTKTAKKHPQPFTCAAPTKPTPINPTRPSKQHVL